MDPNSPSPSQDPTKDPTNNAANKSLKENWLDNIERLLNMYANALAKSPIKKMSTWFSFLLEQGRLSTFPFNWELNEQYAKVRSLKMGSFQPNVSPCEDWAIFVNELWKHLALLRSRGISPVQYELTLEPHFCEEKWARIHSDMVQVYTGPSRRIELCSSILYHYTLGCYSMEARIRDSKKKTTIWRM